MEDCKVHVWVLLSDDRGKYSNDISVSSMNHRNPPSLTPPFIKVPSHLGNIYIINLDVQI